MESGWRAGQDLGSHKNVESIARNLVTLIQQTIDVDRCEGRTSTNPSTSAASNVMCPPRAISGLKPSSGTATTMQSSVTAEMQRSFPGLFRGKRRFTHQPRKVTQKMQCFQFYVLPSPATVTPKGDEELKFCQAGLGMRMISLPEDAGHDQISEILTQEYPKLMSLNGSWMFYKASGGSGRRRLTILSPQVEGYTTSQLKRASNGGKNTLYIAPLQGELDVSPLPINASEFSKMPKAFCENCQEVMPLHLLALHVDSCTNKVECCEDSDVQFVSVNNLTNEDAAAMSLQTTSNEDTNTGPTAALSSVASCPICCQLYPTDSLEVHATLCGESILDVHNASVPLPQRTAANSASTSEDWRTVEDPKKAIWLFTQEVLHNNNGSEENRFAVDVRKDKEEQDRSYVSFYKRNNVEWASPLRCRLEGDAAVGVGVNRHVMSTMMMKLRSGFHINLGNGAITKLFDGQSDHLVPANSAVMVESELFLMAGRMLGHCFLYGGPAFPGLSPAIKHVLSGGTVDTATVTIEDCADLDIRETIQLLEENSELQGEQRDSVVNLCMAWDLPLPNLNNMKWLHDKLLLHAVLERSAKQVKQLRKGLKETGIWPLLSSRPDVVKLFFPCEKDAEITPQMILAHITWPKLKSDFDSDDDDDENDASVEAITRVTGYLRNFIEHASSAHLKNLLQIWVGWEVPPNQLIVKVTSGFFPRAMTCFETIKLPDHYTTYKDFESDLVAAVTTCHTGFGLV